MTTHFRHIAVTVDKTLSAFRWRLIECEDTDADPAVWSDLSASGKSFPTYHAAMAAGLLALQDLVDHLDDGPTWTEEEPKPAPRRKGAFGFGSL